MNPDRFDRGFSLFGQESCVSDRIKKIRPCVLGIVIIKRIVAIFGEFKNVIVVIVGNT